MLQYEPGVIEPSLSDYNSYDLPLSSPSRLRPVRADRDMPPNVTHLLWTQLICCRDHKHRQTRGLSALSFSLYTVRRLPQNVVELIKNK
jgi:hypothetical protein